MMKIETSKSIPVLQLSLRRSGSTTLYKAVTAHPFVDGPSEFWSFHTRPDPKHSGYLDRSDPMSPINFASAQDYDPYWLNINMQGKPVESWWLRHILSHYTDISERLPPVRYAKETWGNLQLGFISALFPPNTRYLYLQRDLRGIIASYKESDLFNKWRVRPKIEQVRDTVLSTQELADRYHTIFDGIRLDTDNWIDLLFRKLAVLQTELVTHTGRSSLNKTVAFADLIQFPQETLIDIFSWIGLPYSNEILALAQKFTQAHQTNQSLMHPLYRRDHPDAWVIILTQEEQEIIESLCAKYGIPLKKVDKKTLKDEVEAIRGENTRSQIPQRKTIFRAVESSINLPLSREDIVNEITHNIIPVDLEGKSIYFSKYLITNTQFAVFLNWLESNDIHHNQLRYLIYLPARGQIKLRKGIWEPLPVFENHPVVSTTWLGAFLFAKWIGSRLPSYQEWMNAYNDLSILTTDAANFDQAHGGTTEVGLFPPNQKGLYDMLGNVSEWTDTFVSPESVAIPGGSWEDPSEVISNHFQDVHIAILSEKNLGFRVVSDTPTLKMSSDMDVKTKVQAVLSLLNSADNLSYDLRWYYERIKDILE